MDVINLNKALISKQHHQLVQVFKSGQLLCLKSQCLSGVILQKPYFADFIGPGAVVGGAFDLQCTSVYLLGSVEFMVPETPAARRTAFQQRISYVDYLQEISQLPSPIRRSHAIISWLSQQFGQDEVSKIPHQLLAALVGVLPESINTAWIKFDQISPAEHPQYQNLTQVA